MVLCIGQLIMEILLPLQRTITNMPNKLEGLVNLTGTEQWNTEKNCSLLSWFAAIQTSEVDAIFNFGFICKEVKVSLVFNLI